MNTHDVNYYLNLPYHIEIIRDTNPENPGWVASVTELPGCITQADTFEELQEMITNAMSDWIETALEENIEIPEPREEEEYSGQFRTRVQKSLHRKLVETADREGVSMNSYISNLLAESLGSVGANSAQHKSMAPMNSFMSALESICQAAGLKNLEGKDPEVKFTKWFQDGMRQIDDYIFEDRTKAFEHLAHMIMLLRPHCVDSPILLSLVDLLDWTKQNLQRPVKRTSKPTQRESELDNIINKTNKPLQAESTGTVSSEVAQFAKMASIGLSKGSDK